MITRALGTEPDVEIDTLTLEGRPGDVYLLCSDGLSSMVDDAEILAVLEARHESLDAAARELVRAANRSGGEDNITVVCFELGAAGEAEPQGAAEADTLDGTVPAVAAPDTARPAARAPRWLIALPFLLALAGLILWLAAR